MTKGRKKDSSGRGGGGVNIMLASGGMNLYCDL
jgi:hypothetical protein